MHRPMWLLALAVGCGSLACGLGSAPPIDVAAACSRGDLTVQIEAEHPLLAGDATADAQRCATVAETLGHYREEYELRFDHLELNHIPVRLRVAMDLRTTGVESQFAVSGHTYGDAIDIAGTMLESFPHELNHVRAGSGHDGWCIDYEPWSEAVLGINQRGYLGCR